MIMELGFNGISKYYKCLLKTHLKEIEIIAMIL
jgi:hypothetical protein